MQRFNRLEHTLRGAIYTYGVGIIFCLFICEVFLGPNSQTGRREFTLFYCIMLLPCFLTKKQVIVVAESVHREAF